MTRCSVGFDACDKYDITIYEYVTYTLDAIIYGAVHHIDIDKIDTIIYNNTKNRLDHINKVHKHDCRRTETAIIDGREGTYPGGTRS